MKNNQINMKSICLYFQINQPLRLRTYRFFDIGKHHDYFDDYANRFIMQQIAEKCYLPANEILMNLIKKYNNDFKVSFCISGITLEQFEMYTPEVLQSFKELADTGCVEFLAETYYHSLASLKSEKEFKTQVRQHTDIIEKFFDQKPKIFRNTELIYSDDIGKKVFDMGFKGMITEGAKHILGWKSPNFAYCNTINPKLKLLLRNSQLSDDIALRFSQKLWDQWPLTTEKFSDWLNKLEEKEETVNLFLDYETFGERQNANTGIFAFLKALPQTVLKKPNYAFNTPAELISALQPISPLHVSYPVSWTDEEKDLTAWAGNEMQEEALNKLYSVENNLLNINDKQLMNDWRHLQNSSNFYYMSTKWLSDGAVPRGFNPYNSPYDAFINFMNILSDFFIRLENSVSHTNLENLEKQKSN